MKSASEAKLTHCRQVCWAHRKRDPGLPGLVDWGAGPRPVGERLLACHAQVQVFALWHRFRAGELTRAHVALAIGRVAAELRAVLEAGRDSGYPAAQPLCRELLAVWPFVLVDGVAPTNNAAEQARRPAVLWRTGSSGGTAPPAAAAWSGC